MTIFLAILKNTAWGWGLSSTGALVMAEHEAKVDGMDGEELAAWLHNLEVIEVRVQSSKDLHTLLNALEIKEAKAA